MAMLVPVRSPTSAHSAFAVLSSTRAVPNAAPNHAFEGTACQRGCASLRPAVAAPQRSRWASQETLAAELVLEANRTLTAEVIGNKGVIRDPLVLAAE
jgi:hypothetical protein